MVEDRRLAVLRAIVQDYVTTSEPVGSKALVQRHHLAVSPATIRNDMAALEDEGYIAAPHTSAGRIPTDKGYRLFVDKLSEIKPLSPAERKAIQTFLDSAVDLDDVVDRSVRMLSQLTHQVAVMQYPSLTRSTVRHIELVALAPSRVLVVLITDTGRVEQRVIETSLDLPHTTIADLRAHLNEAVAGQPLTGVAAAVQDIPARFAAAQRDAIRQVLDGLEDTIVIEREERIVLAGTANLARTPQDFMGSISPVLDAIEEHVVLLQLLSEMAADGDVAVRIGHENTHAGLVETSVVGTGYGSKGEVVAHLGVLGPTRMDYPTTIAAVRAVARYVSRILTS